MDIQYHVTFVYPDGGLWVCSCVVEQVDGCIYGLGWYLGPGLMPGFPVLLAWFCKLPWHSTGGSL
jgi:hypothetical protein